MNLNNINFSCNYDIMNNNSLDTNNLNLKNKLQSKDK